MRDCNGCHPQGAGGLGPALNDKPVPAAAIKLQVRQGMGAMPAFAESEISAEELDQLVAFLSAKGAPWGG
jgi:mono/diheme cytochrome c family protein